MRPGASRRLPVRAMSPFPPLAVSQSGCTPPTHSIRPSCGPHRDIDLVSARKSGRQTAQLLIDLGYTPNERFNAMNGGSRLDRSQWYEEPDEIARGTLEA